MSSSAEFEEEVPASDAELGSDSEVASEPAVDFAGARSCLQSCRGSGPGASTCWALDAITAQLESCSSVSDGFDFKLRFRAVHWH